MLSRSQQVTENIISCKIDPEPAFPDGSESLRIYDGLMFVILSCLSPPRRPVEAQHFTCRMACGTFLRNSVLRLHIDCAARARRYRDLPPPTLRTSIFIGENSILRRDNAYFSRAAIFRRCQAPAAGCSFSVVICSKNRMCLYKRPARINISTSDLARHYSYRWFRHFCYSSSAAIVDQ